MNSERIREITTNRLREWGEIAVEKHATPALLVCVGHDQVSGQLHLMIPENVERDDLHSLLLQAIARL